MNRDDGFRDLVQDALRNAGPPAAPREAMWRRIRTRRRRRAFRRRARWAAVAALLVLGVALGRFIQDPAVQETPAPAGTQPEEARIATAFEVAAQQHLSRTEAFLTSFPTGMTEDAEAQAHRALDLLTATRMLAGTPVAADPEMARVLGDLELFLARIATLPVPPPAGEMERIEHGIHRSEVLRRVRATLGPVAGT